MVRRSTAAITRPVSLLFACNGGIECGNHSEKAFGLCRFRIQKHAANHPAITSGYRSLDYQIRGPCTRALALQRPGSHIDIIASLGNSFPYPDGDEKAIIAGGGIGIGPMLFLAASLAENGTIAQKLILKIIRNHSKLP